MPHPPSPLRPSSTDVSTGFDGFLPPKDPICMSVPLQSPGPLSSVSPRSVISTTMAAAYPDSASSKELHLSPSLMGLDDTNAFQWTAHHDTLKPRLAQPYAGYHLPPQHPLESTAFFECPRNGLPYSENYNINYPPQTFGTTCPRSYTNPPDPTGLSSNMSISESYPPSMYQIEPPKHQDIMDLSDQGISTQLLQLSDDYEHHYAINIKVEDHGGYVSPYSSDMSRCSTPNHDPPKLPNGLKSECVSEENPIDREQPYAQLIYRALLEQPGHTMILRDIYNWFKENTDKAADKETKGWQNSIRHNLSMNGAFEKVDQPCEESKKGFMWRLTDEAIRGGVKSTTRYRSKQPNKRGHRSQHPLPQRQASGAKGGQAARRSAKMRRSNRMNEAYRSEPYMSRSVPTSYSTPFGPLSTDISISYPRSPYFGSEADNGYTSMQDGFGSPAGGSCLDLVSERSYSAKPLAQGTCHDSAYVLNQDPSGPLFINSPSPSEEEPPTPPSPGVDWGMDIDGLPGSPFIFGDSTTAYHETMQ